MNYRYLRIAWSLICGTLCALMIAWWVRGYWWADGGYVRLAPAEYLQYHALEGRMCLWFEHKPSRYWYDWWGHPLEKRLGSPDDANRIPWFDVGFWPHMVRVYAAHCFLAMVLAGLAAIVWFPRRFTTRGILIATTAVATILGAIIFIDNTV